MRTLEGKIRLKKKKKNYCLSYVSYLIFDWLSPVICKIISQYFNNTFKQLTFPINVHKSHDSTPYNDETF